MLSNSNNASSSSSTSNYCSFFDLEDQVFGSSGNFFSRLEQLDLECGLETPGQVLWRKLADVIQGITNVNDENKKKQIFIE